MSASVWLDRFGSLASLTCALHCGLFAFAPAAVALLGLDLLAGESFEWGFFVAALLFALLACVVGYRAHRRVGVVAGFVVGAGVLSLARLGEAFELFEGGAWVAVAGGVVLVGTHIANARGVSAGPAPA